MPFFSFGTPHIKCDDWYIGVGHIKICTDPEECPYKTDSNIEKFRRHLYDVFKQKYREKYIRHDAFNSELKKVRDIIT
jgi:hypothetical protein